MVERFVDVSTLQSETAASQQDGWLAPSESPQPISAATLPVTAAIVNYNTRHRLARCLASLAHEPISGIIVVDNASTDGSAAFVANSFPDVDLIANPVNPGYGAALNQALRAARSRYVFLLNADTEILPGAVEQLYRYLELHPRWPLPGHISRIPKGNVSHPVFHFRARAPG